MPRLAANLSMMFQELDFMDRFGAAADAGFQAVEYLFPYDYRADDLRAALDAHGLIQALHNLPAGDWDAGERGIACHPDRVSEFRDGVCTAVEYAAALGCTKLNCLAGIAPKNAPPDTVRETFVSNLRFAADELEKVGVFLLIEAINTKDIPGFYLQTTDQALRIVDAVGSDNLKIQYDIYHMQIMEGDLTSTIEANLDSILHMQLADNPGRHEPGTGEINFPFLLRAIDDMGYGGWIGCEYRPSAATTESLQWAVPYLQKENGAAIWS